MAKVEVKYNPYRLQTDIKVDGLEKHCSLQKLIKGKRLQECIGDFPKKLQEELNTKYFDIDFYGMELDWDDFEESFQEAFKNEIIREPKLHFVPAKSNKDIEKRVVQIFNDLQEGPVEEFRDPKLKEAFDRVNNNIFTINVIGVMSSGKSTLINALLGKNLISSPPIVCTTTITKIIDNNNDKFTATVYNKQKEVIEKIDNLNDETIEKLSSNSDVDTIIIHEDIPFIDSDKIKLMIVDTPSIYSKQYNEHITNIFKELQSDANSLILYVLNGTQLGISDDDYLLSSVAEEIKKGGKQVRDRFLFVINKMDVFNPEEESMEKAIDSAKKYLAKHGIHDPQIFPCSAFTALNLRTHLKNIDIDNLTAREQRNLAAAAKDTIPLVYKFIDYPDIHLEKYSIISPTTKKEIQKTLEKAQKEEDTKIQALIHCGIYSIEEAIKAYVKKYVQTKKVKDLVETFQEVLNNTEIFEKAKSQIANDEELARKFAERIELIEQKIEAGNETIKLKERVDKLNPIPEIQKQIRESDINLTHKIGAIFKPYGDYITSSEVINLIKTLTKTFIKEIIEIANISENVIHKETLNLESTYNTIFFDFDTFDFYNILKKYIYNWRENCICELIDNIPIDIIIKKQGQKNFEFDTNYIQIKISSLFRTFLDEIKNELIVCIEDETEKINIEKEIEENKKVLNWLEDKKKEIDSILDI